MHRRPLIFAHRQRGILLEKKNAQDCGIFMLPEGVDMAGGLSELTEKNVKSSGDETENSIL